MLYVGHKQRSDVLREVLAVAVEGDGVGKAPLPGVAEAFPQGDALAPVLLQPYYFRLRRHRLEKLQAAVGAAVAYDYDVIALLQAPSDHIDNGPRIVVCGDDDADAARPKTGFQAFLLHTNESLA